MIRSIIGTITAELTSADIPASLMAICSEGIEIRCISDEDDLTVCLEIRRADWKMLRSLCTKRGDRVKVRRRNGVYWKLKMLAFRPVLTFGIIAMAFLTFFLPSRVLFIEVEGNDSVPTLQILEAAQESGITFGASRRDVRSERVKNAMLAKLAQLQWVGVNTRGCVAVISVHEKSINDSVTEKVGVSHIAAVCDGIILTATATRGTLLCVPGQAVKMGDILISGYTDCGIAVRATRAEGEVFAQTRHKLTTVTPRNMSKKADVASVKTNYSIIFGKKRINLCKGSGILEVGCGRMYEKTYITLPGGFSLPIAIVKETITRYAISEESDCADDLSDELADYSREYIIDRLIAGTIDDAHFAIREETGIVILDSDFVCTEMLGREKIEKMGEVNGKNS